MFCPKCGKETPDGAQFCMNCGFNIGEFLNQAKAAAKQPAADAGSQPSDAEAQASAEAKAAAEEAARRQAEEAARLQAEQAAAEEAARLQAEQAARLQAEQAAAEEARQKAAAEAKAAAEEAARKQAEAEEIARQKAAEAKAAAEEAAKQRAAAEEIAKKKAAEAKAAAAEAAKQRAAAKEAARAAAWQEAGSTPGQPKAGGPKPSLSEKLSGLASGASGGQQKRIPLIAAAAAVLLLILFAVTMSRPKYEVNDPKLEAVTPIPGYVSGESSSLNVSFLYPEGSTLRDNESGGIYIYPSGSQGIPFIQITKAKGKQDPDAYFKAYGKKTSQEYPDAKYEEVKKAPVTDKVLYMQRARVFRDGADQVIDRYIEIYPSETVEYTVKSYKEKSEEQALRALIESLRFGTGVYPAAAPSAGSGSGSGGSGSGSGSGGSGSGSGSGGGSEPSAPAPTSPAPTTPAPTSPAPTSPAPTSPAPTVPETAANPGGSGGGSGGGTPVPGQENFSMFTSDSGHFAIMVDTTLVQTVLQAQDGLDVRLKAFADDDTADVNVRCHNLSSEGITTADQFLKAYADEMVANGAARPQIYDMGGGTLFFKGITSTYNDEILGEMAMYLFAANDNKGNIYTIYFENYAEDADAYTNVVNGLFASLTPM